MEEQQPRRVVPSHRAQSTPTPVMNIPADAHDSNQEEFEVETLPSGFKAYPEGTVIVYRAYNWEEINWFTASKRAPIDQYGKILSGIDTLGVEPSDLTLMDFYYIALLRKLKSLGTPQFVITFKAYGIDQAQVLDFDVVDFEELTAPALPAKMKIATKHEDVLDDEGNKVSTKEYPERVFHFSPLTVKNYIMLVKLGLDEDEIAIMAAQTINVDFETALAMLKKASPKELIDLNKVDLAFAHGLKPITCTVSLSDPNPDFDETKEVSNDNLPTIDTKEEVSVRLNSPDTLIFPYRDDLESDGDGVSFGL